MSVNFILKDDENPSEDKTNREFEGFSIKMFSGYALLSIVGLMFLNLFAPTNFVKKETVPKQVISQPQVPPSLGDVDKDNLEKPKKISDFEKLSNYCGAYYLERTVEVVVNEDYSFTLREDNRVKIVNSKGKHLGTIPISYDASRNKLTDIVGYSISAKGKKKRYTRIEEVSGKRGYTSYSRVKEKRLIYSDVEIGTELYYSYSTKNQPLIEGAFFYLFMFEDMGYPAKEVNLKYVFPKSMNLSYMGINLEGKNPIITEEDDKIIYEWKMQDFCVVGRKEESHLPPARQEDLEGYFQFSTMQKWEDIAKWYLEKVREKEVIDENIKSIAREVTKEAISNKDKVRKLLEYIGDNFRYISLSFGENNYIPHSTIDTYDNKYGDCKDLSLLLRSMLKAIGIDADMVFFTSREEIPVSSDYLPMPSWYNHMILKVKDQEGAYYIDPLLTGYDIGEYPLSYQNAYLLIINEEGVSHARFPIIEKPRQITFFEYVGIDPEKEGWDQYGSIIKMPYNYAIEYRDEYKACTEMQKKNWGNKKGEEYNGKYYLDDDKWEGLEKKYGPIRRESNWTEDVKYPVRGELMIINAKNFFTDFYDLFTDENRKNPVFFTTNSTTLYISVYEYNDDFEMFYLPKGFSYTNSVIDISRTYSVEDNAITVEDLVTYKRGILSLDEYYATIDDWIKLKNEADSVIIVKKKESIGEKLIKWYQNTALKIRNWYQERKHHDRREKC